MVEIGKTVGGFADCKYKLVIYIINLTLTR